MTQEQFGQTINQMEKDGKSHEEIQSWINGLKSSQAQAPKPSALMASQATPTPSITGDSQGPSVGGFLGNAASSAVNAASSIGTAVMHPFKTAEAIGQTALGGVEKLGGAEPDTNTQAFDSLVNTYAQRYGGSSPQEVATNIAKTAYQDPVGFLLDLSTVLGAGGGALKAAGKVGEIATGAEQAGALTKAGQAVSKAGEVVNPLNIPGKAIGGAVKTATKIISKSAGGKINKGVLQSASNLGISGGELPISAISNSPLATGAEGLAAKAGLFSKGVERVQGIFNKLNTTMSDITHGMATPTELGAKLSQAVDQFKNDFFQQKNELYKEASIPKEGEVLPMAMTNKTQELLQGLINDEKQALKGLGKDTSPELNTYQSLLKGLRGHLTLSDVQKTISKIEDDVKYGTLMKTGNNAKLSLIAKTLDEQFLDQLKTARPEYADALTKADDFYKQGLQTINSQWAQAIIKNADKPDIIFNELLPKLKSVEDVKSVFDTIGPENSDLVRKAVMDKIFTGAKGKGVEGNLTPLGIARGIEKIGGYPKLEAILDPKQFKVVRDIEKVSQSMAKGAKIAEGSQTAFLTKIGVTTGLVATAISQIAMGNFAGAFAALSPVIGDIAATKFIESEGGRAALTGLKKVSETAKKTSKLKRLTSKTTKAAYYAGTAEQNNPNQ
jgi:hypothetical protein